MAFEGLETPEDKYQRLRGAPLRKGESRLQTAVADKKLTLIDEKTFKRQVRERDHFCCRWCGCKTIVTASRVPNRAEVHHLHGRIGDLRFEERAAALFCLTCHELLTGRVNEKWVILPTQTWSLPSMPGRVLTDARSFLHYERVA